MSAVSTSLNRLREWIGFPCALFLLTRLAIAAVVVFSLIVDPHLHNPQPSVHSNLLVTGLTRWDGGWFIELVHSGYDQPVKANFFPLFPMLGRCLAAGTGLSAGAALVVIANVASLFALIVVYRLFVELNDVDTAKLGLSLLVAWPFAFIQAAAYPESLMMLSTAAALLLAVGGRHLSAGATLGVGILARHLTALAWLGLLVEQVRQRGVRRLLGDRGAIGLLIPAAFPFAYFVFLQFRFGNWHAWLDARSKWGNTAWWGLYQFFTDAGVRLPENVLYVILSVLPLVGILYLSTRRGTARSLAAFGLTLMLLLYWTGLAGLGRYSGSCWPAFLGLAMLLKSRRGLQLAVVCACSVLQGMALYLWAHLYPFQ